MWWILGIAGIVLLAKILEDLGWNRNCEKEEIYDLPISPGVYILHYPNLRDRVYIGSTNNLKRRLYEHRKKPWRTFDWFRTKTTREAQRLERKLKDKFGGS